ncbi:MAG: mucoidy inhibitor MuiA family protein [Candidatus Omnitrophica bacterium]|nr:mucoidy inhibitor MuiA family protein [Candidatus Omnitrophota bacterium]
MKFSTKFLILGIFLSCSWGFSVEAEMIPTTSQIREVTVYPGAAHITREASIELSPGEHSVVFEGIIPEIDENSLSVAGRGTAQVKLFGAYMKKEYRKETADKRVQELQKEIQEVADQIHQNEIQIGILDKKIKFLDSVTLFSEKQLPKDLVTTMPTADSLAGTLKFLSDSLQEVEQSREAIRLKNRELAKEKEVLERQLGQLQSPQEKLVRSIVVDLKCEQAGKFSLDVAYLVHGANWRSVYDARSELEKGQVDLTAYGVVQQTTGEDWQNVELTLSTARPTQGGRMPYVSPWIIQEVRPMAQRRMAMMEKAAAPAGQYQSFDMAQEGMMARVNEEREKEADVQMAEVGQKGVSVIYKLARPVTIKSDGTENKYPISTQTLKAEFEYSSYPRVSSSTYLGSVVNNSPDLQLLPGEINLFLGDDYVGKSNIDYIQPGQEFNLFLGVDDSVQVKREEMERKMDDVLIAGIPSANKNITVKHKLTIENYKNQKIKYHLFEAIPVSENDRIKVKTFDVSVKPTDVNWKDRKGIWHWVLELQPGEKKEITYGFNVEYPRDMVVPGL